MVLNSGSRINQKVCFICGAGHSGSTLLGLILGSHQDCFYSGEARKARFMQNTNYLIKTTCNLCGINCPVWKDFITSTHLDLYEQISLKTQKPIVIDSTKNTSWLEEQIATIQKTSSQPFLIFLQRDGRAVINSRTRKYPQINVKKIINDWKEIINETQELYRHFKGNKIKIKYEHLATNVENVIRTLCDFLEIDYQPQMVKYYQHEHHPVGGNNGTKFLIVKAQHKNTEEFLHKVSKRCSDYYQNHGLEITLDLRWHQELDPTVERLFEEIADKENEELKWEV